MLTTIHNINVSKAFRSSLTGGKVALGLFQGVLSWSKDRGAAEVLLHVTSGVGMMQTTKFANKLGFEVIGGSYVKEYF